MTLLAALNRFSVDLGAIACWLVIWAISAWVSAEVGLWRRVEPGSSRALR